jgi:site-specific recombinase XerD
MKEYIRGFHYNAAKRAARFEMCAPGSRGRRRTRRWIRDVSREEAKRAFARFRERAREGRLDEQAIAIPTSFAAFKEQVWPVGDLAPKTSYNETLTVEKALVPYFGSRRLVDITEATLMSFRRAQIAANHANSTVNGRLRVMRKLLRFAVRQGFLDRVPHFPPPLREDLVQNEMDANERRAFLAAFGKTKNASMRAAKAMFTVALEAGLGRADLIDLRHRDVKSDMGLIIRKRTKTGVVSRPPITRRCRAALNDATAGRKNIRPEDHVFLTKSGRPVSPVMWDRYFREALRLEKITRHVRPHDLRHSYGSRLASLGVPLMFIRDAMGHTDIRTTQRYAKVNAQALAAIVKAMESDDEVTA